MATYDTWGGSWGTSWALSWTRTTGDTHDGFDDVSDIDRSLRKRDEEFKRARNKLREDLLRAVERVTGKPPQLDAPLKSLAAIAKREPGFDYAGTLQQIAALDGQIKASVDGEKARLAAIEYEREQARLAKINAENDFILLLLLT